MNREVKGLQFLVNEKNSNLIHKVSIRILREGLKDRPLALCDSQSPRGKCLSPAVKIPYRGPCDSM